MILRGLTLNEFNDVIKTIEDEHRVHSFPKNEKCKFIKYVDFSYDTRSSSFWSVTLRGFGEISFRSNSLVCGEYDRHFVPYESMYDWIKNYLQGNWRPKLKSNNENN